MSDRYDILFRGDIREGFFLQQVKEDLARLMKANSAAVASLFSGRAERLKKNIDETTAAKYKKVLEGIGMVVELKEAHTNAPPQTKPQQKAPTSNSPLSLSDVGTDVLDEATRKRMRPESVVVDTSSFTVQDQVGNLIADDERHVIEEIVIDTSGYDITELGEDLLIDDDKSKFIPLDIDLAKISLSDVGADLQDEKDEVPVSPVDISKIELSGDLSGDSL